jgi:ribosome maturation factor RimP
MTTEKIAENINNFVSNLGYLSLDIFINKRKDFYEISFAIFKKDGITVDDCEKVTLSVKDFLTVMLDEDFSLDVSSPGAERVLKSMDEVNIFKDRKARVVLKDGTTLLGILKGLDEKKETLMLKNSDNDELRRINVFDVAKCKLAL